MDVGGSLPVRKRWLCRYGQRFGNQQEAGAWDWQPGSWEEPCYFFKLGACKQGADCERPHDRQGGHGEAWRSQGVGAEVLAPSGGGASQRGRSRFWPSRDDGGGWGGSAWDETRGEDWSRPGGGGGGQPCLMFQQGCCWYDRDCFYPHVRAAKEEKLKTKLCLEHVVGGLCRKRDCPDAHSKQELETPRFFEGVPGFKACLCTYHMVGGPGCSDDPCFFAHGELDLRRVPLGAPRSLAREQYSFGDTHVHLDHVLYSRKYGACWFYKFQPCKRERCPFGKGCMFVHNESEQQKRVVELGDFLELVSEIQALPGNYLGCVHNCCDIQEIDLAIRLVEWGREHWGGKVFVSFGIHPTNFEDFTPEAEQRLVAALEACGKQAVAWGECGLDYYRRNTDIEEEPQVAVRMQEAFERQARVAVRRNLPLVVHSREAEEDTLRVLRRAVPPSHPVHLHSFMGSLDMLQQFLETFPNGCMGVAGVISYPGVQNNGGLSDLVKALPLDRLLLETDGPFMAPNPYRGEESHPGHIPWVAEGVAQVKGASTAEVLAAAHANFRRLYRI